jgi:hypothetical protein
MTLSIGKYCAGAFFGVRGVDALVMAIPGCAVVTDVPGRERGSVEAAADSHSHSGLVARPNVVDATPTRAAVRCSMDVARRRLMV